MNEKILYYLFWDDKKIAVYTKEAIEKRKQTLKLLKEIRNRLQKDSEIFF